MGQPHLSYQRRLALLEAVTKNGKNYPYVQDDSHPMTSMLVDRTVFRHPFVCVSFPETKRRVWVFATAAARKEFIDLYIEDRLEV